MSTTNELIDIVDHQEYLVKSGVSRDTQFLNGEYWRSIHVWIINELGEFLIQKRSIHVKHPGLWSPTAGGVKSGETIINAAQRELYEELGLNCKQRDLKLCFKWYSDNVIASVFLLRASSDILETVSFVDFEVEEVKFFSEKKILTMTDQGEFFDYGKEYFDAIFNRKCGLSKIYRT